MYVEEECGKNVRFKAVPFNDNDLNILNFKKGHMALHVADTILSEVDRQKSRERVQKREREGDTRRNRILKIQKKLTAGKLVLNGRSYHLDHTVLEHVERRRELLLEEKNEKKKKEELEYLKMCYHADKILETYGADSDVSKWKRKEDIVTYIMLKMQIFLISEKNKYFLVMPIT